MNPKIMSGADVKLAPLISFYTIFDLDVGLIQLVFDQYLEKSVFDETKFLRPVKDIIEDLYYRKDNNPLYSFAHPNIEKSRLDNFYNQFQELCMDKILDKCITTEIIRLVGLFDSTNEIKPTILYYSEKQLELLDDEPTLKGIRKVHIDSLTKADKESFYQFYFKSIDELEPFIDNRVKSFYISNYGPNLNEEGNNFKDSEYINTLIRNRNQINIFSLYNEDIIRSGKTQ